MSSHFKRLITIINPAAGSDSLILSQLNDAVLKHGITNEILVSHTPQDCRKFALRARRLKPDAVVVYGGDGTVVEVAAVLYGTNIPLIIIPGGTANILAKELGVPLNTVEALKILGRKPRPISMNVASIGKEKMLLRVEVGILAQMVKDADSDMKQKLGVVAYSLTALKGAVDAPTSRYTITIDGKQERVDGVGLMVANVGNIGLPGVSLQAKVSCKDNKLDVLVLQSSDIATLVALGSSALMGTKKPVALKHWQGKEIRVSIKPKQAIVSDDKVLETSRFTVKLKADNLTFLV